jgi:hypothetical protein
MPYQLATAKANDSFTPFHVNLVLDTESSARNLFKLFDDVSVRIQMNIEQTEFVSEMKRLLLEQL